MNFKLDLSRKKQITLPGLPHLNITVLIGGVECKMPYKQWCEREIERINTSNPLREAEIGEGYDNRNRKGVCVIGYVYKKTRDKKAL